MYYPRSFLKFILLGFLLVSLPLVYALAELILSLDRLATQGREEVLQAAQAGRASRQLFEQATTLERLVRQQLILEDPALLDDYARMRQEFQQTTQQLSLLPLEPTQLAALDAAAPTARAACTSCCASPQRTPQIVDAARRRLRARSSRARRRMLTATNAAHAARDRAAAGDRVAGPREVALARACHRRPSRSRSRSCSRC